MMDLRPIEMLHIINKSAEVTKIQSSDQSRLINIQQHIAEENKVIIQRRMKQINDSKQAQENNRVLADSERHNEYQSPSREEETNSVKRKEDERIAEGFIIDIKI